MVFVYVLFLVIIMFCIKPIIIAINHTIKVLYFRVSNFIDDYDGTHVSQLLSKGEYDKALEIVETYLKKRPNNLFALNDKGRILIQLEKPEEAMLIWLKLNVLLPNHDSILNNLSWACDRLKLFKISEYYADRALAFEQTEHEYVNRGNASFGQSDYISACDYYDSAIKINSRCALAYWGNGISHFYAEEYEDAIYWFLFYKRLCPDDLTVYSYLISSYIEMGQFIKSVEFCYEKIAKDPEEYSTYITLGRILIRTEKYHEGLEVFEKAITKKPAYSSAYYGKSLCLAKLGLSDEALPTLKFAVDLEDELLLNVKNEPSFQPILRSEAFRSFILEKVCGNEKEKVYH